MEVCAYGDLTIRPSDLPDQAEAALSCPVLPVGKALDLLSPRCELLKLSVLVQVMLSTNGETLGS